MAHFGPVVLFGSGETAAIGQKAHHWLFSRLPQPIRVSILETPAGFQPNSAWVAGEVSDFLKEHLTNFPLDISVVPARQRGTEFSPDLPEIVAPLRTAGALFLGAGSPTYAVTQLQGSLAWHVATGRHRLGAGLVLASAAVLAVSSKTLPVYEIYKVGEPLHWKPGLDFFAAYGLELVFVPHWNNTEGGAGLDTCYCFMGRQRFEKLVALLPASATVVGIDEQTALVFDFAGCCWQVMGSGAVTLLHGGVERRFESGSTFEMAELGHFRQPDPALGLPSDVWQDLQAANVELEAPAQPEVPSKVTALVAEREAARQRRDWAAADQLRTQVAALGWKIKDTPDGPAVSR